MKNIIILLGVVLVLPVHAQEYSMIEDSTVIGSQFGYPVLPALETPSDWSLDLESVIFFKNLELSGVTNVFGTDIDGETYIGALAPVRLVYRPEEKFSVELGVILGQDFGDDEEFNIIEPLIRLTYHPTEHTHLIGGSILPTHAMHDALLDDVQKLREKTEQGFQVRADLSWFKHDTWLNWRVREETIEPEEFEVGTVSELRLLDGLVRIDGQAIWKHVGGQISEDDRVENNTAYMGGVRLVKDLGMDLLALDRFEAGVQFLASSDETLTAVSTNTPSAVMPEDSGSGVEYFARLSFAPRDNVNLVLHGSVFSGEDLLVVRGDPLYGLEDYVQFGVSSQFRLADDLGLELGFVAQQADDELVNTYMLTYTWGNRFPVSFGP